MDGERIQISAEESGERIDALLARIFPALSRSLIQKCMEQGAVTLNGRPAKKNARAAEGDLVDFVLPETEELPLTPQDIPLDVVYEDSDLIVVNKPRGLVVHPAPGHPDGTLVNALLYHCGDSLSGVGGAKRPGIVHRIDKDTSGLLVAAKNDFAHQGLSAQLADHSLYRVYEAVACGSFRETTGTVDRPIAGLYPHPLPAGDRAHPPDPGTHGLPGPPPAGGRALRRQVSRQGAGGPVPACEAAAADPSAHRRRADPGVPAAGLFSGRSLPPGAGDLSVESGRRVPLG